MSNIPLKFTKNHHNDVYPTIDPSGALKGVTEGKMVLVTGAGRGIGKAVALALARSGTSILILTSRNLSQLSEVEAEVLSVASDSHGDTTHRKNPIRVIKQVTDVTDEKSVEELFARLKKERVGRLDALINNAGYLEKPALFGEQDWTVFQTSVDANTKGTSLPTMLFIRHNLSTIVSSHFPSPATLSPLGRKPTSEEYKEALDGVTIVNTSSIGAFAYNAGMVAYQTSKTWINRFTELLHFEHGATHGLRTFAYHPGGIRTDLSSNMPPETHDIYLIDKPELPGGYLIWLFTERADFLRGRYSSCHWDVDEMIERRDEIENGLDILMTRLRVGGI